MKCKHKYGTQSNPDFVIALFLVFIVHLVPNITIECSLPVHFFTSYTCVDRGFAVCRFFFCVYMVLPIKVIAQRVDSTSD